MMNPEGGKISAMPGMDMPDEVKPTKENTMPGMDMPVTPKPVKKKTDTGNTSAPAFQQATFGVSGNCEMCKDRIEEAAKSVKGVSSAVWDVKSKKIKVEYNNALTSLDAIQKAIAKAGHDTEKFKADDKVYNSLPTCCLYRK